MIFHSSYSDADLILTTAVSDNNRSGLVKKRDINLSKKRIEKALSRLKIYGNTIPDNIESDKYEFFKINDRGKRFIENGGYNKSRKLNKYYIISIIALVYSMFVGDSILNVIKWIVSRINDYEIHF